MDTLDRANKAGAVLALGYDLKKGVSDFDALVDLLTDLRHWATFGPVDFHAALDRSYQHYITEKAEENY